MPLRMLSATAPASRSRARVVPSTGCHGLRAVRPHSARRVRRRPADCGHNLAAKRAGEAHKPSAAVVRGAADLRTVCVGSVFEGLPGPGPRPRRSVLLRQGPAGLSCAVYHCSVAMSLDHNWILLARRWRNGCCPRRLKRFPVHSPAPMRAHTSDSSSGAVRGISLSSTNSPHRLSFSPACTSAARSS